MTTRETRLVEDALYRDSASRFFRDEPNRGPTGENLDIPTWMRAGADLRKKKEVRK